MSSQQKEPPREIISINKVHSRGRVFIPKEIRDFLNVKDGDKVVWVRYQLGKQILVGFEVSLMKARLGSV